jgi:hypothetical protein
MRIKISVIGGESVNLGDTLARTAVVGEDLHGAAVVVLGGEVDLEELRDCAPAAVVLVTGDGVEARCKRVYEATLFPRSRIIGVADPGAAAESVVFERGGEHDVVAMVDGEFGPRRARLGRGGITELL